MTILVEKYRPDTVKDTILPEKIKSIFLGYLEQNKTPPHLILTGSPGIGKTTVARAMVKDLGSTFLEINGSLEGNIDTLRTKISNFASSMSMNGKRKYVILDEADNLTNAMQLGLRNFMETYAKGCGFILTCNYINKIIEPVRDSRCAVIDFKIDEDDKLKMMGEFFKRLKKILETEKIEYDKSAVAELVSQNFPDFRRTLNQIQKYAGSGKIDTGILSLMSEESIQELLGYMKEKNFSKVVDWVGTHSDVDTNVFIKMFYDRAYEFYDKSSVPQLVLILGEYQDKATRVVNQDVNLAAMFANIMVDCIPL